MRGHAGGGGLSLPEDRGQEQPGRTAPEEPDLSWLDEPIEAGWAWTLVLVGDDLLVESMSGLSC